MNDKVINLFGGNTSTAQAVTTALPQVGKFKVPRGHQSDIGKTLYQQLADKGVFYTVDTRANLTVDDSGQYISTGKATLFNIDTQESVGVMSESYKPVQNEQVFTGLFAQMDRHGIDVTNAYTRCRVDNGGSKAMAEIILPSTQIALKRGDELATSIRMINSFDGSTAFWIIVSVYRVACMNGMVMPSGIIQYKSAHCSSLSISRGVEVIARGMEQFQNDRELLEEQTRTMVTHQDVYEALAIINKIDTGLAPTYTAYQDVIRPTLKRQPAIERHMGLWNKYRSELGSTQWALNNVLTHISTHGDKPEYTQSQTITGRVNKEKLVHEAMQHVINKAA